MIYDQFINYRVRIYTKDKHFFEGTLVVTDEYGNVMIDDCEEFLDKKDYFSSPRKYLGVIFLPGHTIKYTKYLYRLPITKETKTK